MAVSQENSDDVLGQRYLEDQFYTGITYNLLLNRPNDVSQNSLSNGLHIGFIKDLPINKRRNIGFGIGVGYNINTYFSNFTASKANNTIVYQQISSNNFSKNRYTSHIVEMPLEFRWRTSDTASYEFWRIYSGIKLGYVFANSFRFQDDTVNQRFSSSDIQRFQYGVHVSFGYHTWNFYAYYGLDKLFEDGVFTVENESIQINDLKIGLMFYIL